MPFGITQASARTHPCFYAESKGRFGRIHLPVAPHCNIQCAYCRRDHDCPHENRPGVTNGVISPEEALERLEDALEKMPYITVVGIAGPGDAFCKPELTLQTFEHIRRKGINIACCVSTNGLNLADHIASLRELDVRFVTLTINAIDPGIGALLCKNIQTGHGTLEGKKAAGWLIDKQMQAISLLKAARFVVKVNSVIVPGVNDRHIPFLAKRLQSLDVDLMNLIPLLPLPGTDLVNFRAPHPAEMQKLRKLAGRYVPQMHHCRRCRSDAIGLLDQTSPLP